MNTVQAQEYLKEAIKNYIEAFEKAKGNYPERAGLKETPERYVRVLKQILIKERPIIKTFPANNYDGIIIDKGIKFYSLCEHHILPFFGTVDISYIPNEKIIGLSKLARVIKYYAGGLQTQEYLCNDILNELNKAINPKGMAIRIKGRHLCKEMRGAESTGEMITLKFTGEYNSNELKNNFINSIQ